jgi:hypothetical protein
MAKRKAKTSERGGGRLSAEEAAILAAIEAMRSAVAYREAEGLRRERSALALAKADPGSKERAAAGMLISTWMSIGTLMKGVKTKGPFFKILPICQMYKALREAVEFLRKTTSDETFAQELFELYDEWEAWVDAQGFDPAYVTAMCGGLTARFG